MRLRFKLFIRTISIFGKSGNSHSKMDADDACPRFGKLSGNLLWNSMMTICDTSMQE